MRFKKRNIKVVCLKIIISILIGTLSTFQFSQADQVEDTLKKMIPIDIINIDELNEKNEIKKVVSFVLGLSYTIIEEADIQNDTAIVSASILNKNCKFILVKKDKYNRIDGHDWLINEQECTDK